MREKQEGEAVGRIRMEKQEGKAGWSSRREGKVGEAVGRSRMEKQDGGAGGRSTREKQ